MCEDRPWAWRQQQQQPAGRPRAPLLLRPLQEWAGGEAEAEEEQGFRIGGSTAGTPAKAGLEVVHVLHGLGPPSELEDGGAGVAPHPGGGGPRAQGGFVAAARAEHQTEAGLFRRLLLSRGAPG